MQIYLARNNVQAGPYSLEQVNAMLADGQVAMTDLMWHAGMQNWQTVGEMTHNNRYYNPPIVQSSVAPTVNIEKSPNDNPSNTASTAKPTNHHQPKWVLERQGKEGKDIAHAQKQLDLAPIGTRVLAKLIDFGLFIVATMPFYITMTNNPNFGKLMERMRVGDTLADSQKLMMDIMTQIPSYIMVLTYVMLLAILMAQILLLVKRGQTIGKLALGIRVLDKQSNAIPKFTHGVLLRSIATIIFFVGANLGLDGQVVEGILMLFQIYLVADFITLFTNKDKQSLHDKIANTYVVIANDNQVTPLPVEPTV